MFELFIGIIDYFTARAEARERERLARIELETLRENAGLLKAQLNHCTKRGLYLLVASVAFMIGTITAGSLASSDEENNGSLGTTAGILGFATCISLFGTLKNYQVGQEIKEDLSDLQSKIRTIII